MPQEAIDRIHQIAERQKVPDGMGFLHMDGSIFEDIIGAPSLEHEDDSQEPVGYAGVRDNDTPLDEV